jgi:hypothetical protein
MKGKNRQATYLDHVGTLNLKCDHHRSSDDRVMTRETFVQTLEVCCGHLRIIRFKVFLEDWADITSEHIAMETTCGEDLIHEGGSRKSTIKFQWAIRARMEENLRQRLHAFFLEEVVASTFVPENLQKETRR